MNEMTMEKAARTIRFGSCHLLVFEAEAMSRCESHYPDGTRSIAFPPWGDPEHVQASWFAGYGGDQWRMTQEHEMAHHFLADLRGLPYSYSVWGDAHGKALGRTLDQASDRVRREEHVVTRFQRFVNLGIDDDPWGILQEEVPDLTGSARRFLRVARPWLESGP